MSFDWKNIVAQHGKPAAYTVVIIASMFLLMKFCGGNKVERDMDGKLDTVISRIDSNEQKRQADADTIKAYADTIKTYEEETNKVVTRIEEKVDAVQETVDRTWERIDCALPPCDGNAPTQQPNKKPNVKPNRDTSRRDTIYIQQIVTVRDTVCPNPNTTPAKKRVKAYVRCTWVNER